MQRLSGKVALITGGAQGMGEAHARAFIGEGAHVIITDINHERGAMLAEELGGSAVFIRHDVVSASDWARVVLEGEQKFGPVTILVNNAGVLGPFMVDVADVSDEDYARVCEINQTSVFLGMKSVIPVMKKAGGGSIVNVSSMAGLSGCFGDANLAYVASKWAIRGMTKVAAIQYGADNIRVNAIYPGYIRTPMMGEAEGDGLANMLARIPLGRVGAPEEVSKLVVFLASDDASYVTGADHSVDGGVLAC